MRRLGIVVAAGALTALLLGWFLVVRVPNWFAPRAAVVPAAPVTSSTDVRKIRARLFYVSQDGIRLVGVERDVPFGETPPEQAQALVEEQLKPAPEPLLSPLPVGTSLRGVFVTEAGDAYVDLTKEAVTAHTGGSLDELFSVYAIVNTLTINLPAIRGVQILVEGKEVDSLAGHIDLRGPLPRNDRWATDPASAAPASAADVTTPMAPAGGTGTTPAAATSTAPAAPAKPAAPTPGGPASGPSAGTAPRQ